jgi:hypothetical protein
MLYPPVTVSPLIAHAEEKQICPHLPKPVDMTTGWPQGDGPLIQDSEPG